MSLSATTFRWLEILELEFDRAYVELDNILTHPEAEIEYVITPARQKMALLCAAFAQLTEKTQTIFQTNAKLEALVCSLRRDLVESQSKRDYIEQEHRSLLFQFHKIQLESVQDRPEGPSILMSLMHGKGGSACVSLEEARLNRETVQLEKENLQLREWLIQLQSELYGAHLATRYLDKELAGRIQQIQLLARDARAYEHNQLWHQLETEITLQRHKTIIQACRSRSRKKGLRKTCPEVNNKERESCRPNLHTTGAISAPNLQSVSGLVRQVEIYKEPGKQIGLAVTGGQDHGVPILISEIKAGELAECSGQFIVGDALLSVNGHDLQKAQHAEAVELLARLEGNLLFELLYVQPDSEDETSLEDFSFQRDRPGETDSLRPLSAHSQSNSGLSRLSQRRRPRFPGRAVDVTCLPSPGKILHGVNSF